MIPPGSSHSPNPSQPGSAEGVLRARTQRPGLPALLREGALFVTGTDTEVGKTVMSVTIGRLWWQERHEVCAVKAVAAGGEKDPNGAFVCDDSVALASASTEVGADLLEAIAGVPRRSPLVGLERAMAPYTASLLERHPIDFHFLIRQVKRLRDACAAQRVKFLVEGAGGALVPLAPRRTVADLIASAGIPAVVVARTELGTINHTLMTLEALAHRGVRVAGVIFSRRREGPLSTVELAAFHEVNLFLPPTIPLLLAGMAREGLPPISAAPPMSIEAP